MKTTDKYFPMYKVIGLQLLLLIPSYLIVRFLLFRLHRSDDAPLIAAGVSAIGIFITYLTRKPFVFEGTIYGYLISFGISQIFKKDLDHHLRSHHRSMRDLRRNTDKKRKREIEYKKKAHHSNDHVAHSVCFYRMQ